MNVIDAVSPFIVTGYGLLGLGAVLHTVALGLVSRGVLAPTRLLPTGGVWDRLSTMEKMTGIGVFVAALAAAATLISAGTDLFITSAVAGCQAVAYALQSYGWRKRLALCRRSLVTVHSGEGHPLIPGLP